MEVPRALRHAIVGWKHRVCQSIVSAPDGVAEGCVWKVFVVMDLLLFGDLEDTTKEVSKRRTVAARMELLESGNRAGVWSQVGGRRAGDVDAKEEAQDPAERVQQLLEADQMSRPSRHSTKSLHMSPALMVRPTSPSTTRSPPFWLASSPVPTSAMPPRLRRHSRRTAVHGASGSTQCGARADDFDDDGGHHHRHAQ